MREKFIEQARLVCPVCRHAGISHLRLDKILRKDGEFILEGFLACPYQDCQSIYPILEGVPVILKDIAGWWNSLGMNCGPGNTSEMREYFGRLNESNPDRNLEKSLLSSYTGMHYALMDDVPDSLKSDQETFWKIVMEAARPDTKYDLSLDMGCSVGRYTFELAGFSKLAIGMDINFNLVSTAAMVQRTQEISYDRKEHGNCFKKVQKPYSTPQNVLFIVSDALDPPFTAESFDLVSGLNLLDNVKLPLVLLGQMDALLRQSGKLILSSPYQWRTDITESVEWLENDNMDAPTMLPKILGGEIFPQTGFKYEIINDLPYVPWIIRHHNRHWSLFFVHFIKAEK